MFDSIAFEDLANLAQVGTGSFGKIYVADGTDVAVKTFLGTVSSIFSQCNSYVDISHQEVQVDLKKYIEREFMGCATHENKLLLVTEYVSGGNVKEWIADCSRDLGWRTRISIATDAARALAYLHAHDIIHRDMKSENLLVTENKRIKVCDFGFSRPTAKTAAEVRRLSFCGTDTHMAPEIILGMPFDSKVDIFSYGVVLCELALRTVAVDNPPCVPSIEEVEQDLKIRIAAPPGSEVAVMALGRVIPGFGLNGDLVRRAAGLAKGACVNLAGMEVEEMSLDDIVKAFVELALRCCDDEPCGRPTWKEILSGLRIMEKIAEREEPDEDETEAEDFESLEDLVDCQEFGIPYEQNTFTST
ncbi:kinase-like domain-containing protein [Chytridium lagenaria]|nr:kinase-like domain-containing protein [Chytridium lagenaria]